MISASREELAALMVSALDRAFKGEYDDHVVARSAH
jgi:hypothetical protein